MNRPPTNPQSPDASVINDIDAEQTSVHIQPSVYNNFDSIHDLQPQWDAFVESIGGDIFSTFDFCRVWWKHYGDQRQLQIHIIRNHGKMIAVLPLFWEKLWIGPCSVRMIRLVGCDHSVTTISPAIDPDFMEDVIHCVVDHLEESLNWDMIHFGPIPGYAHHRKKIADAFSIHPAIDHVFERDHDGPHIIFNLPDSYEKYLGKLSGNERKIVRNRENRITKEHTVRFEAVTMDNIEEAFSRFVDQHQTQWLYQGQLGHFVDWPGAREYHKELVQAQVKHKRFALLQYDVDDITLGYQYSYHFGSRIHLLLTSRNIDPQWERYSPGRLLHCATVRAAIDTGATQLDAMRGMYEYKLRLGGTLLQLQSVIAIHRGSFSKFRVVTAQKMSWLLHLLYYRIWFGRVAPKIPMFKRPLWKKWIRSRF